MANTTGQGAGAHTSGAGGRNANRVQKKKVFPYNPILQDSAKYLFTSSPASVATIAIRPTLGVLPPCKLSL